MKIYLDNVNIGSRTGPNTFALRLATALYERGHELVGPNGMYDVMLSFIEPTRDPRAGARLVQRLDGIWFKPDEINTRNARIRDLYDRADLVIFQSDFDRDMVHHHWGWPRDWRVIHNGIDTTPVPAITIPSLQMLRDSCEMMFVCSSNWHPQKRLRDNIALFEHLRDNFYPSSALIVMGRNPDALVANPHIYYAGDCPPDVYLQTMSAANWMIHLAWLDHCPNVVLEALSQGTPVICTSEGGTKEIVEGYGIILKEERYDLNPTDYDNPPRVDVTQITAPLPTRQELSPPVDISIQTVAERYERALEGIL